MKSSYADTAQALRDALRLSVDRGAPSSLATLHQRAIGDTVLLGEDACAQAARIRRQLDLLPPAQRALLIIRYAPRVVICTCRRRCCAGHYPNPEWSSAVTTVLAHTAPLFVEHVPNARLRQALIVNLLTRTHETAVELAQRCGVHRTTVSTHSAILSAALIGTRHQGGAFDHAFERIDTLLRDAGIVVSDTAAQAA
ncbi:hypothetical protein AAB992_14095 [Burkholderia contaminans]|uniref:hypothetical protein n=1 Tax=Burkholderia contaminans TaxID=488447 RepID=UPI002415D51A|nr:hypothetical protein [Burkholderia contaminans]WFN14395.1 hypothetical protein LXE92_36420 [Burkholderia contaminans]